MAKTLIKSVQNGAPPSYKIKKGEREERLGESITRGDVNST